MNSFLIDNLKKQKFIPTKHFGQNFLINKDILKKIVETADISPEDIILEIGPGTGILTKELSKKAKKIIAIEKDLEIIKILKKNIKNFKNQEIELIQEDALKFLKSWNPSFNYKVVANPPYYIASPIIRFFLETEKLPEKIILMIQKEVAERICAKPPKMNLLSVSIQLYAKPKIISFVSKENFWPKPKVDSAIIEIIPNESINLISKEFRSKFFKIVKAGFSQPRKQLANNISEKLRLNKDKIKKWLLENNIQPEQRAETLSLDRWISLTKSLHK